MIDTATWQIQGPPISVGPTPTSIAISPDGRFAYVTNSFGGSISVIDTQTAQVVDTILVGDSPEAVTFAPSGAYAYVTMHAPGAVLTIDTRSREVVGEPVEAGPPPGQIVVEPNQGPIASFSASLFKPRVAGTFDGLRSVDPGGQIARFDWSFGDGQAVVDAGPTPSHVYSTAGTYSAMLIVTDSEGCSTTPIFTGQTAYCNGSPQASQTQAITAGPSLPAIRVRCPGRARGPVCRFRLRAVANRKNRSRAQSAVTRARVRRGASAVVSIRPKARFEARLTRARRILMRGVLRRGGQTKRFVRWFRVVR